MATRSVHNHDSAEGLVSLEDARERVLSKIKPLPPIELPLTDAYEQYVTELQATT